MTHAGCPLAPSPGTAARSCFAPAMSDDAREKGSRDGSKQGICVGVIAGEPEQRLARTSPPRDRTRVVDMESRGLQST